MLHRDKDERNTLYTVKIWKAKSIGHILRRSCLLKRIIEGNIEEMIEVTRIRARRGKQLLDDFKETRRYCTLKQQALDRSVWRRPWTCRKTDNVMMDDDDDDDDDDDE